MLRYLRIAWLCLWLAFGVLAAMHMHYQAGFRFTPDWFLALLCYLIAVAPSANWPRRFSLRTLLIVMTVVALVLGLAYALRK